MLNYAATVTAEPMDHYFQDRSRHLTKRRRTRSALIDGAIATVAERGVADASIREITSRVGLSNGTFYNHFEDRDDLIREAASAVAEEITRDVAAAVSEVDEGLGKIVLSTELFIERALSMPDWAKLIVSAVRSVGGIRGDLSQHLRADIALAVEQGAVEDPPNRLLYDQVGALVGLAIETQLARGRSREVDRQTCESILRLLGLTPKRARRSVDSWLGTRSVPEP